MEVVLGGGKCSCGGWRFCWVGWRCCCRGWRCCCRGWRCCCRGWRCCCVGDPSGMFGMMGDMKLVVGIIMYHTLHCSGEWSLCSNTSPQHTTSTAQCTPPPQHSTHHQHSTVQHSALMMVVWGGAAECGAPSYPSPSVFHPPLHFKVNGKMEIQNFAPIPWICSNVPTRCE